MSTPTRIQFTPRDLLAHSPDPATVLQAIFPEGLQGVAGRQLHSLAQASDPQLFLRDLLALGREWQSQGETQNAAAVFHYLVETQAKSPLGQEAASRLELLQGGGSRAERLELQTQTFLGQATDWKLIVPMMAASSFYHLSHRAIFTQLSRGAGRAGSFTASQARLLSGAGAFVGETTVFSLGTRSLLAASGAPVAWDVASVGQDWLRAGLTLGVLKGAGKIGAHGSRHYAAWRGQAPWRYRDQAAASLLRHGSGYLGLVGAHYLEAELGLAPHSSTPWLDGLSAYLSLTLGAKLGYQVLGPKFAAWQQRLASSKPWPADLAGVKEYLRDHAPVPGAPMMLAMNWMTWAGRGRAWAQRLFYRLAMQPRSSKERNNALFDWDWSHWAREIQPDLIAGRLQEFQAKRGEYPFTISQEQVFAMTQRARQKGRPWEVQVWQENLDKNPVAVEPWLDRMFPFRQKKLVGPDGVNGQMEFIAATGWQGGRRRLADMMNIPELTQTQKNRLMEIIGELQVKEAIPGVRRLIFDSQEATRLRVKGAQLLWLLGDRQTVREAVNLLSGEWSQSRDHIVDPQLLLLDLLTGRQSKDARRGLIRYLDNFVTMPVVFEAIRQQPQIMAREGGGRDLRADFLSARILECLFDKFQKFYGVSETQYKLGEFLIRWGLGHRVGLEIAEIWSKDTPFNRVERNLRSLELWAQSGERDLVAKHLEAILHHDDFAPLLSEYSVEIARVYLALENFTEASRWARRGSHHGDWDISIRAYKLLEQIEPVGERERFLDPDRPRGVRVSSDGTVRSPRSYALGKIVTGETRVMHLTGEPYSWGERKFGRWRVQEVQVSGPKIFFRLKRTQGGEDRSWPDEIVFEVAELDFPFIENQEVWFLPGNAVSGGIDMVKNPAARYAQRNRGADFLEENLKTRFWLMPFVNEEILDLLPGAKVHHQMVRYEVVGSKSSQNPTVKIATRGPDPIWGDQDITYQFSIPYRFGKSLGLFDRLTREAPLRMAPDSNGKLVVIPDMLPKDASESLLTDNWSENNLQASKLPPEVDSNHWNLSNEVAAPLPKEVESNHWGLSNIGEAASMEAASVDSAPKFSPEKLNYLIIREPIQFGLRNQTYWIYPKDHLLLSGAKYFYPARINHVEKVEDSSGGFYEAQIYFPNPQRRPAGIDWVSFRYADVREFPYRPGEKIVFIKGVSGASGSEQISPEILEREVVLRDGRGRYFQVLGVQIKKRQAIYFPSAPIEHMEWRRPFTRRLGLSSSNEGAPEQVLLSFRTKDFKGVRKTYRFWAKPEDLNELGLELLPNKQVNIPDQWAFMVRPLNEVIEQFEEDLLSALQSHRNGATYLAPEIRHNFSKLMNWYAATGRDSRPLYKLFEEYQFSLEPPKRAEQRKGESPVKDGAKKVAWIGVTQRGESVTLVEAESPQAPQSAPTWVVVRMDVDKVVLGRKSTTPGERPKGFLHIHLSDSDIREFSTGQRFKVIHHVSGAAGRKPHNQEDPIVVELEGNDGNDYKLISQSPEKTVLDKEFLQFLRLEKIAAGDPFRKNNKPYRVVFARGSLGDLAYEKQSGRYSSTLSFDVSDTEAEIFKGPEFGTARFLMLDRKNSDQGAESKDDQSLSNGIPESVDPVEDQTRKDSTLAERTMLTQQSDGTWLWNLDPNRSIVSFGKKPELAGEIGIRGYLALQKDRGVSQQHAQIFYLGEGKFSLRNTSSHGTQIHGADGILKQLKFGEEMILHSGDRVQMGSVIVQLEFPSEWPAVPKAIDRERRSLVGENDLPDLPSPLGQFEEIPNHIELFSENQAEQSVVFLGRMDPNPEASPYPMIRISNPVVALNHLVIKRWENGYLDVTPLELGGPAPELRGNYGTWVQEIGRWTRKDPGKTFKIRPGQLIVLGSVILGKAVGPYGIPPANLSEALVFRVGPEGRSLERVDTPYGRIPPKG